MPVLVVQMGHCYRKTGATGTTGEQAYATSVANACVNLLHGRDGWSVRKILADDNLDDYEGDAFVAIHCDGSTSSSARGASIGYRNRAGQLFGQAWKRAYADRDWTGGFRPDNYTDALHYYYGTGNAISQGNERAFIAECGFMTNAQDRALLTGPGGPTRVALAIGDALGITSEEDDLTPEQDRKLTELHQMWRKGNQTPGHPQTVGEGTRYIVEILTRSRAQDATIDKLSDLVASAHGLSAADVKASVKEAIAESVIDVDINVGTKEGN